MLSQRGAHRLIPCCPVLGYQSRLRRADLMINLLSQGHWALFFMLLIAIVIALSFHEFGHAWTARCFGDDTAERMNLAHGLATPVEALERRVCGRLGGQFWRS